ncbi:hypothetical protein ElyMa_006003500 [Elysia marginata]|uniref:Uncharacterized protein n=1 Tax=Elysia marginata TaxID=1093978 RepID=A0AAV4GG92_9GAST|nr:hypothetical protein ElyMa_006003500 [Elysia marginata]
MPQEVKSEVPVCPHPDVPVLIQSGFLSFSKPELPVLSHPEIPEFPHSEPPILPHSGSTFLFHAELLVFRHPELPGFSQVVMPLDRSSVLRNLYVKSSAVDT